MADMLLPGFDSVAEMYMYKLEDQFRALQDPYYLETISADEDHLLEKAAMKITVGEELVVIEDGKIVLDKRV